MWKYYVAKREQKSIYHFFSCSLAHAFSVPYKSFVYTILGNQKNTDVFLFIPEYFSYLFFFPLVHVYHGLFCIFGKLFQLNSICNARSNKYTYNIIFFFRKLFDYELFLFCWTLFLHRLAIHILHTFISQLENIQFKSLLNRMASIYMKLV